MAINRQQPDEFASQLPDVSRDGSMGSNVDSECEAQSEDFIDVEEEIRVCSVPTSRMHQLITQADNREKAPAYQFPNTWEHARNDSVDALKNIGGATVLFGKNIVNSGIGKAGLSIGSALAATAGKGAKSLTTYAIKASVKDSNKLPRSVKNWIDAQDEKKRRAIEARQTWLNRKKKIHMVANGLIPESNLGLNETHPLDEVEVLDQGTPSGTPSMAIPWRRGSLSGFPPSPYNDDGDNISYFDEHTPGSDDWSHRHSPGSSVPVARPSTAIHHQVPPVGWEATELNANRTSESGDEEKDFGEDVDIDEDEEEDMLGDMFG